MAEKTEHADLLAVTQIFASFGMNTRRFTKAETRTHRTPDFRIFCDDKQVAYCEVKSPRDDWLDEQFAAAGAGIFAGGGRKDPAFNRLSRAIEKAASQFDAVNVDRALPNILFFVNHCDMSDIYDLRETLTGLLIAEDGTRYQTNRLVSDGRIKKLKLRVDLYVWYDVNSKLVQGYIFTESVPKHVDRLCELFKLDRNRIER